MAQAELMTTRGTPEGPEMLQVGRVDTAARQKCLHTKAAPGMTVRDPAVRAMAASLGWGE